jgi:GH25 family lysozyme M1 (1,4-beta-N-acetylmuramidase)
MRARFPLAVLGIAVALVVSMTVPVAAATWEITGIDVSHWQNTIDWRKVADSEKADFVIVKATEGKRYVDPKFATNVAGAAAEGLTVGAYRVATPKAETADARAEADHFLAVAAPQRGHVISALDIELSHVPNGMKAGTLEAWTKAWMLRVTNRLGVRPMLYGSVSMFADKLGNSTWFADNGYPLWLARWGPITYPLPANNWQGAGWTVWQWDVTGPGTVPGITTSIDRDRYAGTDLRDLQIAGITAQPGTGGAIADDSGRLDCAAGATCAAVYSPNDVVHLTATPTAGYGFVSWGGACAGAGATPTCTITARGAKTVTATFSYRLQVKVRGSVAGRVVSSPKKIDCPGACVAPFGPGAVVALTATTDRWSGVTWSGDCTGTDPNGCAVTMDQPRSATATFADLGPATATIRPPAKPTGAVRVSFDQPVHHVTLDNLVVRPAGNGRLRARLTCRTLHGAPTSCSTGKVRTAFLDPIDRLRHHTDYVAIVDPLGVPPIRDGVGRATPRASATFRV